MKVGMLPKRGTIAASTGCGFESFIWDRPRLRPGAPPDAPAADHKPAIALGASRRLLRRHARDSGHPGRATDPGSLDSRFRGNDGPNGQGRATCDLPHDYMDACSMGKLTSLPRLVSLLPK